MTSRSWPGGELRWDHLAGEWAVIAPGRSARPRGGACPFCPGPGQDTPAETWRLPAAGGTGWRMRAVPSRYALSEHHEVIIESPRHDWDLATGTDAEAADLLSAWQQRHRALRDEVTQVVVFRNHRRGAGISLPHPHSQVVGLPVLSSATRRVLTMMREHHNRSGLPFDRELLATELSSGERIVVADNLTVAFVPAAPTTEFEVRFTPTQRRADFATVPADELAATARTLRKVLAALRAELGDPSYNLILRTAPTGLEHVPYLCWQLRLLPRPAVPAGLELATGIPVITTAPEHAAKRLRSAIRDC